MSGNSQPAARRLAVLSEVRCLACGTFYVKPVGSAVTLTNPGCPGCGYVGWEPAGASLRRAFEPRRFAADLRRRRSA